LKVVLVFIVDAGALALFALFFMNVQVSVKTILKVVFVFIVNSSAPDLFALFFTNIQVSIKTVFESHLCILLLTPRPAPLFVLFS
jgi:hypothetical protein